MPTPWNWIGCASLIVIGSGMTRGVFRPGKTLPGAQRASSRIPWRLAGVALRRRAAQDASRRRNACLDSTQSVERAVASPAVLAPALARIGEQITRLFDARPAHVFLPFTTLMHVLLWSPGIGVAGWELSWLVLAVLLDLSHWAAPARGAYEDRDRIPAVYSANVPA